jgi:5-methylcytosine-specific restriction endonuclease McrA
MDRARLHEQLAAGRSIEAIARDVDRDPSTVAYWVTKYGLVSMHAEKHAARGGIAREQLEPLVARSYTVEQIAHELEFGATTVRYWLKRHGLTTARTIAPAPEERPEEILRRCQRHGVTVHVLAARGRRYRCKRCRAEAVSARRRRVKLALVAEAGGACCLCGYDRYPGALQFHHINPAEKSFAIADRGLARSIDRARAEARKCVLVCANCHAELEAGLATIPHSAPLAE